MIVFVCLTSFRTWALSSGCKIDQADFTDCMSFLPSKFKPYLIQQFSAQLPKTFHQRGAAGKMVMI